MHADLKNLLKWTFWIIFNEILLFNPSIHKV